MGMYTAFQCKALIKPEYQGLVQGIIFWSRDHRGFLLGIRERLMAKYPVAQEFLACERADCIFSWMVFSSDYFHDIYEDEEWNLAFVGGLLRFQCAIKDGGEIEKFAKMLDVIAERVIVCEQQYEEFNYSGVSTYLGHGKWSDYPEEKR